MKRRYSNDKCRKMAMHPFHKLSLPRKHTLVITLTCAIALLLACVAFVVHDLFFFRAQLVDHVGNLAEVISGSATSALEFDDPQSATEMLSQLRSAQNVLAACLYDSGGRVFASYSRSRNAFAPPVVHAAGSEFKNGSLHLFHPITSRGGRTGTIYIESSLGELDHDLMRCGAIGGVVFGFSVLIALGLSQRFQRLLSRPILELAEVARAVARDRDYALRVPRRSDDEVGQLINGFNEMLAQIQARDIQLGAARDQLERRVDARTRELAESVSLLNATLEASVDGILALDRDGNVTNHNQKCLALWQMTPDQLNRANREQRIAHSARQLKDPERFLDQFRHTLDAPERESRDVLEFLNGRIVERITTPQYIFDKCVGVVLTYRDITEARKAELALRRLEELYRRAIAGANAVPYSYNYESRTYSFMDAGIERLLGYKPEEVSPKLWGTIIQESIMLGETAGLRKEEAAARVLSGELRQWRCDMRVSTRDGHSRWISDASVQNVDESGRPTGSMGILQDITERKQNEIFAVAYSKLGRRLNSATSAEEAAQIIGDVSAELFGWDAFWVKLYDADTGKVHSVLAVDTVEGQQVREVARLATEPTELHRRILEVGAELILRSSPADPLPGATPFGPDARPSASIMLVPIRSGVQVVGFLSIQSYKPQSYQQTDLRTLQTLADQCGGALERIRADEIRREAELQFRLVWNTSADGMRLANSEGIVVLANESYCRMVAKPRTAVEGHPISVVHNAANAAMVMARHRERIDSLAAQSNFETEVTLWNGTKVWFEISNSALKLPGQPVLLLSIFRDVTQRKQAEAELEGMHRQLLGVSRAAGMAEVATSVLHNVGNVLNSVTTSASVVADRLRGSKAQGVARMADLLEANRGDLAGFLSNNGRSEQVIQFLKSLGQQLAAERETALCELQDLARNIDHIKEIVVMQQSYARISGVSERVRPTDLVEDALRMNAGALSRHQVGLIRDYATDLPEIVVEKHKVLQILVNLIRNAKYACDDSGFDDKQMTVRVTSVEGRIRIAVRDNGVGIPAENLTRIFNHGFTTRKNGHGFGLHSGALVARELGGELRARSDGPGKGAEFILELPCGVAATQPEPVPAPTLIPQAA